MIYSLFAFILLIIYPFLKEKGYIPSFFSSFWKTLQDDQKIINDHFQNELAFIDSFRGVFYIYILFLLSTLYLITPFLANPEESEFWLNILGRFYYFGLVALLLETFATIFIILFFNLPVKYAAVNLCKLCVLVGGLTAGACGLKAVAPLNFDDTDILSTVVQRATYGYIFDRGITNSSLQALLLKRPDLTLDMKVFFIDGTDKLCPRKVAAYSSAVLREAANDAGHGGIQAFKESIYLSKPPQDIEVVLKPVDKVNLPKLPPLS